MDLQTNLKASVNIPNAPSINHRWGSLNSNLDRKSICVAISISIIALTIIAVFSKKPTSINFLFSYTLTTISNILNRICSLVRSSLGINSVTPSTKPAIPSGELKGKQALEKLQQGITQFNGSLTLQGPEVVALPPGLKVGGSLTLINCTSLKSLPEDIKVTDCLTLTNCTGLTSLPEGIMVDLGQPVGSIVLTRCTNLITLPKGLRLLCSVRLIDCTNLTSLPQDLIVVNNLELTNCTNLITLPPGLKVGTHLYLDGCPNLTTIPENLRTIGTTHVSLKNCINLKDLPKDVTVAEIIDCPNLKISSNTLESSKS